MGKVKISKEPSFLEKTCDFSNRFEKEGDNYDPSHISNAFDFMKEETRETEEAHTALSTSDSTPEQPSKIAEDVLDGFLDTAFVSLAGAYKFLRLHGHNHEESIKRVENGMHRVCDANLNKAQPDGSIKRNEVGKVMKPEGWTEPRFGDLLQFAKTDSTDEKAA